jgi:molybdopterin-guanine dinucleotide biosynthesis adapter protein
MFDRVIIADWSAAAMPSPPRPSADAIWLGLADSAGVACEYHRTRASAEARLAGEIQRARAQGQRLLVGCDFPFGYPLGFAPRLLGEAGAQAGAEAAQIWDYLAAHIQDGPDNANNRFDLANAINARLAPASGGFGPFWGRPQNKALPHLPARKQVDYTALALPERRAIERAIPSAQPVWKLYTTGSVGGQALMGLPMVARLRRIGGVVVWPFEPCAGADIVLAEVYPSILAPAVTTAMARHGPGAIKDQYQVMLLARALRAQGPEQWARLLAPPPHPDAGAEGWILGQGQADMLLAAP